MYNTESTITEIKTESDDDVFEPNENEEEVKVVVENVIKSEEEPDVEVESISLE